MNPLLNPNVAYVLLVLGFTVGLLALFSPGTGLLEIGAIFALVLAVYSIANLPFNGWALAVMVFGFVPFVFSLRARSQRVRFGLLGASLAAFILGSAFLFHDADGRPAVNGWLILITSALTVGVVWLLSHKSLEAITSRPAFHPDGLIGMLGRASSDIRLEGTVYVNGEEWTAQSAEFIPAGSSVRVLGRSGLMLTVEPAAHPHPHDG